METTGSDDYIASCDEGLLEALTQAVRLASEGDLGALNPERYYASDLLDIIERRYAALRRFPGQRPGHAR